MTPSATLQESGGIRDNDAFLNSSGEDSLLGDGRAKVLPRDHDR